jgi:hypothetical protein
LDAVEEARRCLQTPVSSLLLGHQQLQQLFLGNEEALSLEETPFGRRAVMMLPKIEGDVLLQARRGLNRWFLALRSGGDGSKAGRAVLRRCAHSYAVGPGQLGLGGHVPPSYLWRSKVADNLLARLNQNQTVARAVRAGFWFDRDASREAERLEHMAPPGMERRAQALAVAFGWYRCWEETAPLLVDVTELNLDAGLSGSRHGSRHGNKSTSLGFRGSQRSSTVSVGVTGKELARSSWATLLTPPILFEDVATKYVKNCVVCIM